MEPVREAAYGLRSRLEADGFSPAAAEYLAVRFASQCMRGMKLTISVDIGNGSGGGLEAESAHPGP
jgi:hypothetical protein